MPPLEVWVPPGSVEIAYFRLDESKMWEKRHSRKARVLAYLYLGRHIWMILSVGYLFLFLSFWKCFEPASSGAVLVAFGIISEAILKNYGWQRIPARTQYDYIQFWWSQESERMYITNGRNRNIIYRTNQSLITHDAHWWNTVLRHTDYGYVLTLSTFKDSTSHQFENGLTSRGWDISATVRRINSFVNIFIITALLVGTFVWAYFDWLQGKFGITNCINSTC